MTTTETDLTTTRTNERLTPWLTATTSEHDLPDYRASHRSWLVSGTKFNSHSSVDISEYEVDGGAPTRSTALHVSTASGIRAQTLNSGGTALVVAVDGGHASMFLPFTLVQIIAALHAEQDRRAVD